MNPQGRSGSRGRPDGQESLARAEPVVAQGPSDKNSQEEELPIENLYIEPGQEGEEGAPAVKDEEEPELEREMQKLGLGKAGGEHAGGSDGEERAPPLPAKTSKGSGL